MEPHSRRGRVSSSGLSWSVFDGPEAVEVDPHRAQRQRRVKISLATWWCLCDDVFKHRPATSQHTVFHRRHRRVRRHLHFDVSAENVNITFIYFYFFVIQLNSFTTSKTDVQRDLMVTNVNITTIVVAIDGWLELGNYPSRLWTVFVCRNRRRFGNETPVGKVRRHDQTRDVARRKRNDNNRKFEKNWTRTARVLGLINSSSKSLERTTRDGRFRYYFFDVRRGVIVLVDFSRDTRQ